MNASKSAITLFVICAVLVVQQVVVVAHFSWSTWETRNPSVLRDFLQWFL